MVKKIRMVVIILLAIFFTVSGIYFYHKSFTKKTDLNSTEQLQPVANSEPLTTVFRKEYDLEKSDGIENAATIDDSKSCSGKRSCRLNSEREYGVNLIFPIGSIPGGSGLVEVKITAAIWTNDPGEAQWVLEVIDAGKKSISWISEPLPPGKYNWDTVEFSFTLPENLMNESNSLKFYPWNKSLKDIWIDNICVNFIGHSQLPAGARFSEREVNFTFDLESDSGLEDTKDLSEVIAHSGLKSSLMNGKDTYSASIIKTIYDVTVGPLRKVSASVWLYPEKENPDAVLALTITDNNKETVFWEGKATEKLNFKAKTWQKLNLVIPVPDEIQSQLRPEDQVTVYVWNRSRMKIYADDFEIVYGEALDHPGLLPNADMNLKSRKEYQFDRYHPPYRNNYLQYLDLNNDNSTFLSVEGNGKQGNLFPQEEIISLKLKSGNEDLLVHLFSSTLEIFQWCVDKNSFQLIGSDANLPFPTNGTDLFAVDLDGDGQSEIFAVNGIKGWLVEVNFVSAHPCSNGTGNFQLASLWEGTVPAHSMQLFADFNNDRKEEWLSVDTSDASWTMNQYQNHSWVVKGSGAFPLSVFSTQSSSVCGYFIPGKMNLQLLTVYTENKKIKSKIYEYNSAEKEFKLYQGMKEDDLALIFLPGDQLIKMNLDNDSQDELLLYRNDWRFDMKMIDCDKNGFYIASQIDFQNYPASCNPKFYEINKPVYGKFVPGTEGNLLMVLRNCADLKFDGKSCSSYGGSVNLPDQLQMYSLKMY